MRMTTLSEPSAPLNRNNFAIELRQEFRFGERAVLAFLEAWEWLVRESLFVERSDGWYFVSRRGLRLKGRHGLESFRQGNILPKSSLHPVIAEKVWSAFRRGEYDTAVFQAFKEVEVAVREAAKLAATDIGKDLMSKAFKADTGPLTDTTLPESERQALQLLFMGAIGVFKNPGSHRHVALSNPREAAEMISFASLLMRIVDSRMP
jgi:uncharacterized protein (TIGR02391 family)